ncbi:MAG TPA: hypothetical protein VFE47_25655 [Tepidisphaeraceae bacterium]|jgi:hypothetical protein|nr:hypothetical protein [Tepidisphaeraceae bacterium]
MIGTTGEQKRLNADTFVSDLSLQPAQNATDSAPGYTQSSFGTFDRTAATRASRESTRRDPSDVRSGPGAIDPILLNRALETIESIDSNDKQTFSVQVASLGGMVCEMWRTAKSSSQYHRQVLAAVDNAIICTLLTETLTSRQISAIREALVDLKSPILTQANVDSIASHMIDENYGPLAMISELETGHAIDE